MKKFDPDKYFTPLAALDPCFPLIEPCKPIEEPCRPIEVFDPCTPLDEDEMTARDWDLFDFLDRNCGELFPHANYTLKMINDMIQEIEICPDGDIIPKNLDARYKLPRMDYFKIFFKKNGYRKDIAVAKELLKLYVQSPEYIARSAQNVTYLNDLDQYTQVADASGTNENLEGQNKTVEWRWTTIKDKWVQSVSIENQKEISSVDEIATYKEISRFSNGYVTAKPPVFDDKGTQTGKKCRVNFLLYIVAKGPRPTDFDPGYIIYYEPHKVGTSWYTGGYANESVDAVIEHEKGHVKAYFEKVKKLMEDYLNKNFKNHAEFSKEDMDKITKKYNDLYDSREHLQLTVKYSNEATINYHDSRPTKYKRLKVNSVRINTSLTAIPVYKTIKTKYVWKVVK